MREAEARYRALVEQIPTVTYVCAFDSEGTILYISPQIEAIVGYPPSRWTEDPTLWQRLIHPEDRERVVAEVARCYEQREQFRDEYRMVAADGRVVWFRDEETLLLDDDGEPRYTQGVLIDITQEKRAERQLRLQHDLARVLAEVPTEEAALPKLLQVLGGDMDWAVGALWVPGDGAGLLRCHLLWHAPGVDAPEFDRLTRELSLTRGMGLPGLAWERRRPVTGAMTGERPVTARDEAAERAGLKAGLAIPVMSGEELLAVIESFGTGPADRRRRAPANPLRGGRPDRPVPGAKAHRGRARPQRAPRSAHGRREPGPAPRPAGPGTRAPDQEGRGRPALHRSRRVQADQRRPWPSRRRRGPAGGCRPSGRRAAAHGHGRPDRGGRVRDPARRRGRRRPGDGDRGARAARAAGAHLDRR